MIEPFSVVFNPRQHDIYAIDWTISKCSLVRVIIFKNIEIFNENRNSELLIEEIDIIHIFNTNRNIEIDIQK